jgi:hypothetical protein
MQPTAPLLINLPEHPAARSGVGVLRLTLDAAREAGMRDGQIIQGTLTEDSRRLNLVAEDGRFLSLPFYGSGYKSASSWYRVEFSPYGVYLKANAPVESGKGTPVPEVPLPALLTIPEPDKILALRSLLWLLALRGPEDYQQLVQRLLSAAASNRQLLDLAREFVLRSETLSPLDIFTALRQSGLFSQSKAGLQPDLRKLLSLLLRSERNQASTDTEDSDVSMRMVGTRLDAAQIEALQARAVGDCCYRFPLRFEDQAPAEVVIKRSREHQGKGGWNLDLELSVGQGLHLSFCCLLSDQQRLVVSAWMPDPDFADKMRARVPILSERLQELGMELHHCVIHPHARPPAAPGDGQASSFECRV